MIEIKNLSKTFTSGDKTVEALKNISLTINDGDIYGIIGMSGAGKSTLVRSINMLERPTAGSVIINGTDIGLLKGKELREFRRNVTMIFQQFNLLMQRTCLKNICFPLELAGVDRASAKKKAVELLEIVGLPDKADAYPSQLSGGQQQRIAIARALATNPKIILCDEATSALDPKTTHSILALIKEINEKYGITVIIITHQMSVIEEICNKVAILDNGQVVEEGIVSDIFSSPKSEAAKRLVYPGNANDYADDLSGDNVVRVVFNGADAAKTPLISRLAKEMNIEANIMGADTKTLGGMAYGNMLLDIKGTKEDLSRAVEYIRSIPGILVEEVNAHD